MARKPKTRYEGKAGRKTIDLCKIDTSRLRTLNAKQMEKAIQAIGPIYMLPQRESGYDKPRWLVSIFLSKLARAKKLPVTRRDYERSEAGMIDYFKRTGARKNVTKENPEGEPFDIDAEVESKRIEKADLLRDADEAERKIWQLQAQAGCKIRDVEVVARDLEYEKRKEEADKLRRESRTPTSHRLVKIR